MLIYIYIHIYIYIYTYIYYEVCIINNKDITLITGLNNTGVICEVVK